MGRHSVPTFEDSNMETITDLPNEVFAPSFEINWEDAPPAYDSRWFPEYVARLGYAIASIVDYATELIDNDVIFDGDEKSTVIVRSTDENDISGFPYEIEVIYAWGALPATVTREANGMLNLEI